MSNNPVGPKKSYPRAGTAKSLAYWLMSRGRTVQQALKRVKERFKRTDMVAASLYANTLKGVLNQVGKIAKWAADKKITSRNIKSVYNESSFFRVTVDFTNRGLLPSDKKKFGLSFDMKYGLTKKELVEAIKSKVADWIMGQYELRGTSRSTAERLAAGLNFDRIEGL
jgi:hypothetical protein